MRGRRVIPEENRGIARFTTVVEQRLVEQAPAGRETGGSDGR